MKCENCSGKGFIPYRDEKRNPIYGRDLCPKCKGTGIIKIAKEPRFRKVYR